MFQCSSASRKFLNLSFPFTPRKDIRWFQCSSASRKFLNCQRVLVYVEKHVVSVLFSEPKIPQCNVCVVAHAVRTRFSALQRAENSSIQIAAMSLQTRSLFQCSSASRKFLNSCKGRCCQLPADRFSALQRAENSSIFSRWFRNALIWRVSVLFSEPKIPQYRNIQMVHCNFCWVSVLFSEPKIPQSSNCPFEERHQCWFQCSSASRKFLNSTFCDWLRSRFSVSVLFSEPKIPQFDN